jgi:hypothetical protein
MKPSYYAIIPAEVRYSDINPSAKLLYGEITALCNQKGYCWASNGYFSELYGVTKNTISTWVSVLKKHGFVSVEVIRNEHKQVVKRKIGIMENRDTPIIEIVKDISKENNTKKESISLRKEIFISSVYVENTDKNNLEPTDIQEFIDYWTEPNKSDTKMRFELERTWDYSRRLQRWSKNKFKWVGATNYSKTTKGTSKVANAYDEWRKAQKMLNNE